VELAATDADTKKPSDVN